MKICLVTTFPPSHGGLSEYGYHIAQELQRNSFVNLTILADELPSPATELDGFSVVRCWSPDHPLSSFRLLAKLRELKPDIVWFNLLFSTFGRNPLNAFTGLMTPLFSRATSGYTHVTLHHLMDTVDLNDLGVRFPRAYRLAGAMATRMLLLSNSVSVLMPRYRRILFEKYGGENVYVRAHGILSHSPKYPYFSRRGNPIHRILAFGKWGTYKRLELMIEAFEQISQRSQNVRLIIAGGDHPQAPGYVESVRKVYGGHPKIEFTGYVEESEMENLFQSSSALVMPYSSSTGCSGVAHLACAYGVPIVSADLEDFRQMAKEEDLAIAFYRAGDAADLSHCLSLLLNDAGRLKEMALQNFSAALRMTMPSVIRKYLRHFELHQQLDARRRLAQFRKLPSWLPSRAFFLRAITGRSANWIDRSLIFLPPSVLEQKSKNSHASDGRGKLPSTQVPRDDGQIEVGDSSYFAGSPDGAEYRNALEKSSRELPKAMPGTNENRSQVSKSKSSRSTEQSSSSYPEARYPDSRSPYQNSRKRKS